MARSKGILKEEFQLERYVRSPSQRHETKKTSFHFQDNLIQKLPFIKDKSIDLYDLTNHVRKFSLVLRLGKKSKTFYIKQDQQAMRKLGRWIEPNNNTHIKPPEGYLTTAMARAIFKQKAKELTFVVPEVAHFRDWTIEKYLDEQYTKDRNTYPIKNNEKKPLSEKTLKALKYDLAPLMKFKVREVDSRWLEVLEQYWSEPKLNPSNGVTKTRSIDTNRKSYTQINAMFNIWVRAGYIAKNPIDGLTSRFKDKHASQKEILVFDDLSLEECLKYLFSHNVKCSIAAKLVLATMIMGGVRNSEAYRNYRENFDIKNKKLTIPSTISLKTNKTRKVIIDSELYWEMVNMYLNSDEYFENEFGHMFPSKKGSKTGHIADTCTREPWKALKTHFALPKNSRAYTFRHTFASRLARASNLQTTANQIGDSLATTNKFYLKIDDEDIRHSVSSIQNDASTDTSFTNRNAKTENLVAVFTEDMPMIVKQRYNAFTNGKSLNSDNKIPLELWNQFVSKLKKLNDRKPNDDVEEWLFFQEEEDPHHISKTGHSA
ncbi:site-specific integrase [Vibrio diazotrophicus]|uniref:tyrosine-type recombinase/integrase n=1 Tax=Vibrio diazotrophicus TaxID=685 RepID=UPI0022AF3271|nr:site-specific integrase [Vibrio diazotrophicus]MCZ4370577.1 site-specific integrase [Vibrio diazotrophicus]